MCRGAETPPWVQGLQGPVSKHEDCGPPFPPKRALCSCELPQMFVRQSSASAAYKVPNCQTAFVCQQDLGAAGTPTATTAALANGLPGPCIETEAWNRQYHRLCAARYVSRQRVLPVSPH